MPCFPKAKHCSVIKERSTNAERTVRNKNIFLKLVRKYTQADSGPTCWYSNTRNGYNQGWNICGILASVTGKCTVLSDKEKVANKWNRNNASNNEQLGQIYNP